MTPDQRAPIFVADRVVRSFGPTRALDAASLSLLSREIHGLVGENGAGKSTMSKVACGVHTADSGTFLLDGAPYVPTSLRAATARGIGLVFQESTVTTSLSVAENVFLSELRSFRRRGLLDQRAVRRRAQEQLDALGADFDADADWSQLHLGQWKIVELARAVGQRPQVLFVDEATAVLDAAGRDLVLDALRRLRERGMTICYVSHHLEELFALTDRVTVMRDGRDVATLTTAETSRSELESLMVGREVGETMFPARRPLPVGAPLLSVQRLSSGSLAEADLEVHPGEVVGLAGLAGCGGAELLRVVAGERRPDSGRLELDGTPYRPGNPRAALRAGVGYLPGERDLEGLVGRLSVRENIGLAVLPPSSRPVRVAEERAVAREMVTALQIKTATVETPVDELSGGNRQKVVLAKLLATRPRLLLLDNPTRGVDVGARAQIYQTVARAAADGTAVLLLSEDLSELLGISDRLLVLRRGRVSRVFDQVGLLGERDVLPHML